MEASAAEEHLTFEHLKEPQRSPSGVHQGISSIQRQLKNTSRAPSFSCKEAGEVVIFSVHRSGCQSGTGSFNPDDGILSGHGEQNMDFAL